jgi:hypothetical protein
MVDGWKCRSSKVPPRDRYGRTEVRVLCVMSANLLCSRPVGHTEPQHKGRKLWVGEPKPNQTRPTRALPALIPHVSVIGRPARAEPSSLTALARVVRWDPLSRVRYRIRIRTRWYRYATMLSGVVFTRLRLAFARARHFKHRTNRTLISAQSMHNPRARRSARNSRV